jgi:hypothetical protein
MDLSITIAHSNALQPFVANYFDATAPYRAQDIKQAWLPCMPMVMKGHFPGTVRLFSKDCAEPDFYIGSEPR